MLSSRRFSWSVDTVSNKACAKENKHYDDDGDDDDDNNDNSSRYYHVTVFGRVIVIDPLLMGIVVVLLVLYIVTMVRKRMRLVAAREADRSSRYSRWDALLEAVGLRNRRSYTIIND